MGGSMPGINCNWSNSYDCTITVYEHPNHSGANSIMCFDESQGHEAEIATDHWGGWENFKDQTASSVRISAKKYASCKFKLSDYRSGHGWDTYLRITGTGSWNHNSCYYSLSTLQSYGFTNDDLSRIDIYKDTSPLPSGRCSISSSGDAPVFDYNNEGYSNVVIDADPIIQIAAMALFIFMAIFLCIYAIRKCFKCKRKRNKKYRVIKQLESDIDIESDTDNQLIEYDQQKLIKH